MKDYEFIDQLAEIIPTINVKELTVCQKYDLKKLLETIEGEAKTVGMVEQQNSNVEIIDEIYDYVGSIENKLDEIKDNLNSLD